MSLEEHAIERTRQTYDKYSAEHASRFWNASVERAWNVFSALIPPKTLVLDLGCGTGRDVATLGRRGYHVIGVDLSMGLLREAQSRLSGQFVQGDMRFVPFSSAQFDGVWMCASLLHIPRKQASTVLSYVYRIMGWGSVLFIAVKQGYGECWQETEGPIFFTYYQPDEISKIIQDSGLLIELIWNEKAQGNNWINIIAHK